MAVAVQAALTVMEIVPVGAADVGLVGGSAAASMVESLVTGKYVGKVYAAVSKEQHFEGPARDRSVQTDLSTTEVNLDRTTKISLPSPPAGLQLHLWLRCELQDNSYGVHACSSSCDHGAVSTATAT